VLGTADGFRLFVAPNLRHRYIFISVLTLLNFQLC